MSEFWTCDLVSRDGVKLGPFGRVTGGSLMWTIGRAVHGTGTIDITDPPSSIDWLTTRLRLTYHTPVGSTPMGVWVPVWPEWRIESGLRTAQVALMDRLSLIDQPIGARYQVPAGASITQHVTAIVRTRGGTETAITPSTRTLSKTLTWEPSKTWLAVVNDLLSAAGYGALWCDSNGWFRAEPWVPPEQRPEAATYGGRAEDLRVLRKYSDQADLSSVPNVVYAVARGDYDTPGLIGRASWDDPDSPLSTRHRGEVVKIVENIEAADQAVIDQHAQRLLREALEVTRRVTYTHPVDGVQLRDRVYLRPLNISGAVVERRVTIGVGPIVEDTLRHIYTGGRLWT